MSQNIKMNLQLLASDEQTTDSTVENTEDTVEKKEKTFTQAELDKILADRIARESKKIEAEKQKAMELQLKAELEESAKLAKMSEAERLKAQAEKERKQFETERAKFEDEMRAFNEERMLNTTMKTLAEKNLPVEFANFLKVDNADDIMENINTFEKHFNEALEKMVVERLRGKVPMTSTTNKQAFTRDEIKNMTTEQINANWDKIQNIKF